MNFALIAASSLALAQAGPATASQGPGPSFTMDAAQSLDCALWAAYRASTLEDGEGGTALSGAMQWFLGRYEAGSGEPFEAELTARAEVLDDAAMDALDAPCGTAMRNFGDRLVAWSEEAE